MSDTTAFPEPFNGGLVTARDPAILNPGELTRAENAIYLPNDPGIHKARGRAKYNTVAITGAGDVKGLRYLEFDGGTNLLAAHTSDDIHFSSFSDETGSFGTPSPLADVGSGATLDAVHYSNKYVLLTGAGQNSIVNADGTTRKHGLAAVYMDTIPTIVSGAWNSALDLGFYHFFVTEVVKDGFTTIESTVGADTDGSYSKTATTAITSITSQSYNIVRPSAVNTNATHWRVYMAGPTTASEPAPALTEFRLVVEKAIADTNVTVGNGAFSGARDPGTAVGGSWTNPNNALTNNNVGARCSVNLATLLLTNFGFSGLTGTITGFEVFVKLRIPDFTALSYKPKLILDLTHNGTNFFPGNNSIYILPHLLAGSVANYVMNLQGNQYETWGRTGTPPWALGDVNGNASFGIRLTYGRYSTNPLGSDPIIDVDNVKIVVHTTGTSQSVVTLEGQPFRTTVVSVGGITTAFGADGPPPVATTGDVFEGQLVLNDTTDQSIIKYSLPDSIESFPFPYFLNFETKTQDVVSCIRRLGNKLIVGLKQGLYRINYLPRESDAEFDRGRAYEAISESDGIVGTQSSTLFAPENGPLFLAYVSHRGLRYTDGFQSRPLNQDIDWVNTVRLPAAGATTDYLAQSILVDYPKLQQIWFYYVPPAATTRTKALVIHYSAGHQREDGTFRITGPIDVPVFAATHARLGGDDILLTGQTGGFVFVEDRGYTHNAGGTIAFAVQSREMYIAGPGREWVLENLFVRHRADTTSTITVTPSTRRGANAVAAQTAKTFATTNGGIIKIPWLLASEACTILLTEPGADGGAAVRLTDMVLDASGHGLPEPRTT